MKNLILFVMLAFVIAKATAQHQNLPVVDLKNTDGYTVSTVRIFEPGGFTMLVFWKSTIGKCCENLESLQNAWYESLMEKGVKMIAICVDCNGTWSHVKPVINARGWSFDTYIDVNGDFKRAMNVNTIPCTILLDENLTPICRQNGFCSGSGELACEKIEGHLK
jgi:cytochrome c biogenesis protein CcmG, thiol:disulfide interchange protein DsbE